MDAVKHETNSYNSVSWNRFMNDEYGKLKKMKRYVLRSMLVQVEYVVVS